MVEEAQAGKAPSTRPANRYALLFVPAAQAIAGAAWLLSGDPVRALAVLVVATPCPLILTTPVVIVGAISQAGRRGILIKNGAALEQLASAKIMLFDKTGTLTTGQSHLVAIETRQDIGPDELLRLAASLDEASQHITAQSLMAEARRRGLALILAEQLRETPAEGLRGQVEGRAVAVGSLGIILHGSKPDARARAIVLSYYGGLDMVPLHRFAKNRRTRTEFHSHSPESKLLQDGSLKPVRAPHG